LLFVFAVVVVVVVVIVEDHYVLGCVSLRKSKIGFPNLKESENGSRASPPNRSIQDPRDHGASKELKNPHWEWILKFLRRTTIPEILDQSVQQRNANSVFGPFQIQECNPG